MMPDTIADVVHRRAIAQPDAPAMLFLERGERPSDSDTYGSLDRAARIIGARLLAMNLRGKAVLLACDTGLPFVRAFLGCLYAGVYAIPVPALARNSRGERLRLIAGNARPAAILLECNGLAAAAAASDLPVVIVDESVEVPEPLDGPVPVALQDIAFIQYTSGSTMEPKGIVITHGNIMSNQDMIRRAFDHDEETVVMSWLPLHHDMGLIGSILQPLYLGGRCILASPLAFLQRPVRWLRAISDHRATTSGAPNFAYELCARQIRPEQCEGLDLSCWSLAFCGSEPVRAGTMQRFAKRFASAGFDPSALYPCYGMAEATLFVTGGVAGDGARSRSFPRARFAEVSTDAAERQLVTDCGQPVDPGRIAIVTPEAARPVAENVVGEICVSGPHVSPGLWSPERPDGILPYTDRLLVLDGVPFIRSGDAGMIVEGGLHIVGRLKDIVIVRGANVHAEDIEHTVLEQPEAAPLEAAAAVAVERDSAEQLVLLCELTAQWSKRGLPSTVAETLRRRVAEAHGLMPAEMVLLAPRSLPRTTSGKIRRRQARADWLDGRLKLAQWIKA